MQRPAARYPDWKAPPDDGGELIWPVPSKLLQETLENQRRLAATKTPIAGIPLNEIRAKVRAFVGHDDAAPLVASGHQTELYHPGVWVKDALAHAAAERLGGQALHLAVDTDAPKHLVLRWPHGSAPITDDPKLTTAPWSGLLAPPTPAHLASIRAQFDESERTWDFEPEFPRMLSSLRRLSLESHTLPAALTNAQHELDWDLGLRHHALLASPLWLSEPFLAFVHHVMSHADRFAADYNVVLRSYRDEQGIRSSTRPMPDLVVSDDAAETPFWLDDLGAGRRTRPSVVRRHGAWVLQLGDKGVQFVFDPSLDGWEAAAQLAHFLSQSGHRLAPRALTLTMFVRLLLADQFVHGIGGGRYDQVTDRLIQRHFQIEPPAFCVTTATLYFPGAATLERACVPCVVHEGHRLRHNLLGERKMQLVAQIDSLPRRSHERELAFQSMRHQLDDAARSSPLVERWRQKLAQTQRLQREQQSLLDRELFYAIQPRDRLMHMIEQYQREFAS